GQSAETSHGRPARSRAFPKASCKSAKTGGWPLLAVSDMRTVANASLLRLMPVRRLRDDEQLELARGDVVVCIPVYGAVGDFAQCLASVLEHSSPELPVLVCDDHSPGDQVERHLDAL